DQEAAHHVHRPEENRREAEHPRERRVGTPQDQHRTHEHDAVDRIRPRHERRVKDHRHLGDDLIADEDREREYGAVGEQGVDHVALLVEAVAGDAPDAWSRSAVGACRTWPSWVTQVSRTMSSSKSSRRDPSLTRSRKNAVMLREYIWLAWTGRVEA